MLLLLLLSRFSPTAGHQAPPSLGFSRQEHWSGLPFPSPMHESEKSKEVAQSCPTLSDLMDCSLPGSSVHGIFPGESTGVGCHFLLQCKKVKVKLLSRVRLLVTSWTAAYQAPPSMGFSRQEYWSGVPLTSPQHTAAAAAAQSLQSCLTLCDPIDGSPPGFPVPGILQARTLERVAISFSNAGKCKVKGSRSVVSDS